MSLRPIWHDIRAADLATLLNAFLGIAAILLAFEGEAAWAWHVLFAAIIVDGLDGAIARLGGGGGPLGYIIDTLADVVTFVVAPTILLMLHLDPVLWAAPLLFLTAGLLRLARFQTLDTPHFHGLSTPGGAILAGSGALLATEAWMAAAAAVLAGALMLSTRIVPKLRGILGIAGVAIIVINLTAFMIAKETFMYTLLAQLLFMAFYFAAGPRYIQSRTATEAM